VFDALRRPLPSLERAAYSEHELLTELIEPADTIRVLQVHKRRAKYAHGECMGERHSLGLRGEAT
jgi:hypothetical protein